jgi:single-strand DNA-binding protein
MAGSLNKVLIIGRLGQDPKLSYLPSGQPVANFNVATDESFKDKDGNKVERTEWHRVAVYGRSAEFCANYLTKGRLVYIEGTLRTRSGRTRTARTATPPRSSWTSAAGWTGSTGPAARASAPRATSPRRPRARAAPPAAAATAARPQRQQAPSPPTPRRRPRPGLPSEASGMDDVPF